MMRSVAWDSLLSGQPSAVHYRSRRFCLRVSRQSTHEAFGDRARSAKIVWALQSPTNRSRTSLEPA